MRESEVIDRIPAQIESLLSQIPFLQIAPLKERPLPGLRPDMTFTATVGKRRWRIFVEAKSVGEPRQVRYAIQQLREYLTEINDGYGVVVAPYISSDTARLCKESGVGYIDLAGNCLLNFDQVYVERTNCANPSVEKRIIKSPFTRRASRLIRVMLTNAKRRWRLQELAQEADVSLGLVFKTKERLLDLEYAREENRGIILNRPRDLLQAWADNYSFRKNMMYNYFSFDEPKVTERRLAEYCEKIKLRYALTLFSGAALVAPFARYTRGFAYVGQGIRGLAESLGLKEVSSGPNFTILEPYDDGVFYGTRSIEGLEVVCDVQLYLDLVGYKGRGEDSAQFLLEQRIEPQW
jgi:hypothetical protein